MNVLKPHVWLNVSNIEDPDGNAWEVFVVKGEAAVMEKQTSAACCCVPKVQDDTHAKAGSGCCG
jgi:hypothetical protein